MEQPATAHDVPVVDRQVWKACAGAAVRVPRVGSRVYYFPQGHAEQCPSPPDISSSDAPPAVLCVVTAVVLLANPETDEVYARICLRPLLGAPPSESLPRPRRRRESTDMRAGDDDGAAAFAKVLTPSDANNAGAFSVPKFCADSIFPRLNFDENPPTQIIKLLDVHGTAWVFRQIFRGAPRRHLLSTGWSRFVNAKKLIAGDSVVFIRRPCGQLFVGIRRTGRSCGPTVGSSPYGAPGAVRDDGVKTEDRPGGNGCFSRKTRGRVPTASVVKAVRAAGKNLPFEVLYYPRTGSPEFVVPEEDVLEAMAIHWGAGMRIRMLAETDDCTRMTWFSGKVSLVVTQDTGPWPHSPWRTLQVSWDEPKELQASERVSPWQVELNSASPHLQPPFPVMKKPRVPQDSGFIGDAEDFLHHQVTGTKSTDIDSLPPLLFGYRLFPAGMQGARHDPVYLPSLSRYIPMTNTSQIVSDGRDVVKSPKKEEDLGTELNIEPGSTSLFEASFPPSHRSLIDSGREIFEPVVSHPDKQVGGGSFLLFGQLCALADRAIIRMPSLCS